MKVSLITNVFIVIKNSERCQNPSLWGQEAERQKHNIHRSCLALNKIKSLQPKKTRTNKFYIDRVLVLRVPGQYGKILVVLVFWIFNLEVPGSSRYLWSKSAKSYIVMLSHCHNLLAQNQGTTNVALLCLIENIIGLNNRHGLQIFMVNYDHCQCWIHGSCPLLRKGKATKNWYQIIKKNK